MEASLAIGEGEEAAALGAAGGANEAALSDESGDTVSDGGNLPAPETGIVFFSTYSPRHTGLTPRFLGPRRRG